MLRILSGLFWTIIVLTCPVFFLGALLLWAVKAPFDRRKLLRHLYSSAWAVFYLRINPLWRLPWRGAAVLVANHASLIDGLVLRDRVDARVQVLAPLDPAGFAGVGALRDAARHQIDAALVTL